MTDLSIIIVNYNTRDLLKKCLESVISNWLLAEDKPPAFNRKLKITKPQLLAAEVIVVDNGSTDGSGEYIGKLKRLRMNGLEIKTVLNKQNLGFAKAVNQGINQAQGKYILLLNSDTRVQKNSLNRLLKFAKSNPQAGIIGARLVNPDGSIQPSVYHFPSIKKAFKEFWLGEDGEYEKYVPQTQKAIEVDAVTGAAMLIPRETIKKVGFFDERYFMYFEDLDYCRRARRTGLKVYYLPEATILHHHGQSAVKVGNKAYQWLCQSSKIYNGVIKYWLLTIIIFLGRKIRRLKKF